MKIEQKTSKILLSLLLVLSGFLFSAKSARASFDLIAFVDPLTGLAIADRYSCDINILYGCDSSGHAVQPTCGVSGTYSAEMLDSVFGNDGGGNMHFCGIGTMSGFTEGNNSYSWTCSTDIASTPCSVNVRLTPGVCGSDNGGSFYSTPWMNTCSSGSNSTVVDTGSGWTWTCSGTDGSVDSCSATKIFAGTCGSANGQTYSSAPSSRLCGADNSVSKPVTLVAGTPSYFYTYCSDWSNDYATYADCYNDLGASGETVPAVPDRWFWSCLDPGGNRAVTCYSIKGTPTVSNGCESSTCTTATCDNGINPVATGTKACDNGCTANTCSDQTCNNGINPVAQGTKSCPPPNFSMSPDQTINLETEKLPKNITISWSAVTDALSCVKSWGGSASLSGGSDTVSQVNPSTAYTITCTGHGNTTRQTNVFTMCYDKDCNGSTCANLQPAEFGRFTQASQCSRPCNTDADCTSRVGTNWQEVAP